LLLYGDLMRSGPDTIVPHPRLHERRFVLGPLAEVAAGLLVPGTGKSVARLLADLGEERTAEGAEERREELFSALSAPSAVRSGVLSDIRALVTGSTSGIGRAIAAAFAAAGAD